jgi:hypothetical protein
MNAKHELTDRQLAELYSGLAHHYQDCKKKNMSAPEIYSQLTNGVYYTLYTEGVSPLFELSQIEKQKVFNVLNTFFYATPEYRGVPKKFQNQHFFNNGTVAPSVVHYHHHHYHQGYKSYYGRNDSFLMDWLIINQLTQRPYYGGYHGPSHGGCWGGGSSHGHTSNNQKDNEALAFLLLLLLAAAVACCAFIAAYYMFSESLDVLERLICNEGMLQAFMTALTMAVTTIASTMLATMFAASPIYALAIAAGVSNPVGWVSFCVLSLGIIGGALGTFISEQVHQYIIKQTNQNAMDPEDPSRFRLTTSESDALWEKGIDPIRVKCAMVALRAEMGNQPVPSLLNRLFSSDSRVQDNLSTIRQLRRGDISAVTVGDMYFNCHRDALATQVPVYVQPQPTFSGYPEPSAPEMDPPAYEEYQYMYPKLDTMSEPPPYTPTFQ